MLMMTGYNGFCMDYGLCKMVFARCSSLVLLCESNNGYSLATMAVVMVNGCG